jgi:hypothetical protein
MNSNFNFSQIKYYIKIFPSLLNNNNTENTTEEENNEEYLFNDLNKYKYLTSIEPCDTLLITKNIITGLQINTTLITKSSLYEKLLEDSLFYPNFTTKCLIFDKVFSDKINFNNFFEEIIGNKNFFTMIFNGFNTDFLIRKIIHKFYLKNNYINIICFYFNELNNNFKVISTINIDFLNDSNIDNIIKNCNEKAKIFNNKNNNVILYKISFDNFININLINDENFKLNKNLIFDYLNCLKTFELNDISIVAGIDQLNEEINEQILDGIIQLSQKMLN